MIQKVVVSGILAQNAFGVIVACRDEADNYLRAILPADICPVVGEAYEISGDVENYRDRYGKTTPQIKAKMAVRTRTSGSLIKPWLESLPGIGATRSQRLLDALGIDVVKCLGDTSMTRRIGEILDPARPDAGERLATLIQVNYIGCQIAEDVSIAEGEFLLRLEESGVTDRRAAKRMFRLIGSMQAYELLVQSPYLAAGLLPWKQADHLGMRLLRSQHSARGLNKHPDRLAGACDSACRDLLSNGDTAISRPMFVAALLKKSADPVMALLVGLERQRVVEAGELLRAPGAAYLERTLAKRIVEIDAAHADSLKIHGDIERIVRSHENPARPLSDEQRNAVCGILINRFSLLQGGAGTGKTTTLKVLVDSWRACGGNVILGALSGKAALRLTRSTGRVAQTLARHLYRLEKRQRELEASGEMELVPELTTGTMFIIDEASMVDLVTLRKLAFSLPLGARIVLAGDVGQLPPVGLGQGYHDLVQVGFNLFELKQVHRQAGGNPIIDVATDVRGGRLPIIPSHTGSIAPGVFHLDVPSERIDASVIDLLDQMALKIPLDEILVLTALKRTCANINRSMQAGRQTSGHDGVAIGPFLPWVSVGEPIICTRNRYDDDLMNGQIGHVNTLEPFTVRWDGEETGLRVPETAYADLTSAWAITCHKAQGSESKYVIVAMDGKEMLTRDWLYTAITRATEQVILVGPLSDIDAAINKRSKRTTYFKQELEYWRTQQ